MATPVGHVLAGCGVWLAWGPRVHRRQAAGMGLCAFFAAAPDLDFLPGLLVGTPALHHQGISHSVAFLLAAACLGASAFRRICGTFTRRASVFGLAYGSHLVMDLFGPDRRPPIGIPLLWPLIERPFLSPWPVFMGVHHSPSAGTRTLEWLDNLASLGNAAALGVELAVVAPFVLLALWHRRRSGAAY